MCGCDNRSGSLSLGYNNNLSKAATVAITYHAARIIYRSSQILDSATMQHGSPTKRKEKPHTHTAATWTAAAHNAAAGAEQRRRWTLGSTRSSARCRHRCGLAAFTGDGSTYSDGGGVERWMTTGASSW